jgi:hypothetical protein
MKPKPLNLLLASVRTVGAYELQVHITPGVLGDGGFARYSINALSPSLTRVNMRVERKN